MCARVSHSETQTAHGERARVWRSCVCFSEKPLLRPPTTVWGFNRFFHSVVVVLEDLVLVVFLGVVQDHRVLPPEPLRMHFGLHFGWRTQ